MCGKINKLKKIVQTKFLRAILMVTCCIPNAVLHLEMGLISLKAHAWIFRINYWLKLVFSLVDLSILTDTF